MLGLQEVPAKTRLVALAPVLHLVPTVRRAIRRLRSPLLPVVKHTSKRIKAFHALHVVSCTKADQTCADATPNELILAKAIPGLKLCYG
jgi:hypothetical protein